MRTVLPILAALTACALSSGCVTAIAAGAAGVGAMALQDRTLGESLDDSIASNEVKARLLATDAQGFAQVDVEVAAGNLLLSGAAPSDAHKQTAELVARNVRSIHNVYNEIVVGPSRSFGRNASDEWITAQIRTRFTASRNVRSININIETFEGSVYLMGLARTDAELQRAAEIASTTPGVRRVVSFMQVRARGPNLAYAQPQAPTPEFQTAPQPAGSEFTPSAPGVNLSSTRN